MNAAEPSVVVLLSTWNGMTRHLREQLDSIAAQTWPNLRLFVRDDGSSDGTPEFLRGWAKGHPDLRTGFSGVLPGKDVGWRDSYRILLEDAPDADYYAFCDQDDVWLPGKIASQVSCLRSAAGEAARVSTEGSPMLCSCAFDWTDGELRPMSRSKAPKRETSLRDTLFYTPAIGFTMLMNAALRDLVLSRGIPPDVPHDRWCLLAAAACGRVLFDPERGVLYRRHDATTTSARPTVRRRLSDWWRREIRGRGFSEFTDLSAAFRDRYAEILSDGDRALLARFAGEPSGLAGRLSRAAHPGRFRPSIAGEAALRLSFLIAPAGKGAEE